MRLSNFIPKNIKLSRWSLLLLGVTALWSADAQAKLMNLSSFQLDNGLQVAVVENHKAPVVLQQVLYKTGSLYDPKGKGGIAHLLEHMMFRGTDKLPGKMFDNLTQKYGAQSNAYTTYDETGYYEFSDISKLELMMALEAERMAHLKMNEADFLKERGVVLQERKQRFESNPVPLFYENLNKVLWQDHPFASSVGGSEPEILSLTQQDATDFYQAYYRPDNAILILAGNITKEEAQVLAKKYYGSVENPERSLARPAFVEPKNIDADMVVKLDGVQKPRFVQYVRLDGQALSKKDIEALSLLATFLAGDDTSYVYDKLIYRDKKLLGVDVGFSYCFNIGGTISFYAIPAPEWLKGETPEKQLAEIKKILWQTVDDGVKALTQEDLDKVKNRALSDAVYVQEDPQASGRFVGSMLINNYTPDEIMNYDERIMAITLDDVLEAWNKVRKSEARVAGYLVGK